MCDRIILLYKGRLITSGSVREVTSKVGGLEEIMLEISGRAGEMEEIIRALSS